MPYPVGRRGQRDRVAEIYFGNIHQPIEPALFFRRKRHSAGALEITKCDFKFGGPGRDRTDAGAD